MAKKTTLKTASLGYRPVGSNEEYVSVMGVLKGLTLSQDEPDANEIEAEFYDTPFDISYDGNPPVMSFALVNFDLDELPPLFGGTYDAATDTYEMAANAHSSEWEWKLDFQKGNKSYVIRRGVTLGTINKEEDGAFAFNVTVTGLTTDDEKVQALVGGTQNTFVAVENPTGNPKTQGYYESDGTKYRLTWDTKVVEGKTYYEKQ